MDDIGKDMASKVDRDSWQEFLNQNSRALQTIQNAPPVSETPEPDESVLTLRFMEWMLGALAESRNEAKPLSQDLEALNKVVAGILEVKAHNIVDSAEAKALIDFVMARFVERRFSRMFRLLPLAESKQWFYSHREIAK